MPTPRPFQTLFAGHPFRANNTSKPTPTNPPTTKNPPPIEPPLRPLLAHPPHHHLRSSSHLRGHSTSAIIDSADAQTPVHCEILSLDSTLMIALPPHQQNTILDEAKLQIGKWPALDSIGRVDVLWAISVLKAEKKIVKTQKDHANGDAWVLPSQKVFGGGGFAVEEGIWDLAEDEVDDDDDWDGLTAGERMFGDSSASMACEDRDGCKVGVVDLGYDSDEEEKLSFVSSDKIGLGLSCPKHHFDLGECGCEEHSNKMSFDYAREEGQWFRSNENGGFVGRKRQLIVEVDDASGGGGEDVFEDWMEARRRLEMIGVAA